MKKLFLAFAFLFPFLTYAQQARITIDTARVVGDIDPKIYGVFMEPIGFSGRRPGTDQRPMNTVYGTLYNPGSPYANNDGFDTRYIDAAKELNISNMRWPGGNYTADYHWMDGVGPKDKRLTLKDLAWGYTDSNKVGTDEWIELNEAIGSENVVCINGGTGTLNEAAYWVEYCNLEPGSYYPDLRAKNGHPKPYSIKYWDLGNEVDGSPWIIAHKDEEDYIKFATEAAKIMRNVDHDLSFIISGSSYYAPDGKWVEWNQQVITGLRNIADYVSIHGYWNNSPDYYTYMGESAMDVERKITTTADIISVVRSQYLMTRPIYISFDEWGAFGRGLLPTLAMAQYFNSFIRHADVVKMANYTLFTSVLDRDKDGQLFKSPLFYTFKEFSNNCRGTSLQTLAQCDTFSVGSYYKTIPYLDVTCVYARNSKSLVLNVVNRNKENAVSTEIRSNAVTYAGKATVTEINGTDLQAPYTIDKQKDYVPVPREITAKGHTFVYSFPAHSFTQITVKIE